jgi:hypothetical protein
MFLDVNDASVFDRGRNGDELVWLDGLGSEKAGWDSDRLPGLSKL